MRFAGGIYHGNSHTAGGSEAFNGIGACISAQGRRKDLREEWPRQGRLCYHLLSWGWWQKMA